MLKSLIYWLLKTILQIFGQIQINLMSSNKYNIYVYKNIHMHNCQLTNIHSQNFQC